MNKNGKKCLSEYGNTRACLQRLLLAAFLGLLAVWGIPFTLAAEESRLFYTNSLLAFLLWVVFTWLLLRVVRYDFNGTKKRWVLPFLFSVLFSVCMAFGAQLETKESVTFTQKTLWLGILSLTIVLTLTVRYLWDAVLWNVFRSYDFFRRENADKISGTSGKDKEKTVFLKTMGMIFLCYLPVFLAVYPGFFVYDAQEELMQVITRNFSTHHPLIHVLLLGGVIQLVYKLTGSYNLGIACYTLLQMLVLSGIFAWCICRLKRSGLTKTGSVLFTLYFGLCPVLVMFSLCSAKDGLFTGMLLIIVVLLRELVRDTEAFFNKKGQAVLLGAASVGMMLLRHNGFYAFLVFAVCLVLFHRAAGIGKHWKKLAVLFSGIFICFFIVSSGLSFVFHADASENQEMLTVPIQQLARVYRTDQNALSLEDKSILYEILPEEALNRYTPKVSDGVKIDFQNEAYEKNPGRYFKLWVTWGVSHPFTYLNAWFMTSYGFWYPDAVIDVYRGNSVFTYTYEDSSYFGYEVEQPGIRESKIPWLDELYRRMSLEIFQQKIPVVSMLFSPGFLFWLQVFILCYFWYRREYQKLIPYLLPFLVWLTVILGPTYLVRYVVFLWVILPVLLFDLISLEKKPEV